MDKSRSSEPQLLGKSPFPNYVFWKPLLVILVAHGFAVPVQSIVRMEAVLGSIPSEVSSSELKYVLAPIFATNATQQEKFYKIFDEFLASYPRPQLTNRPAKPSKKNVFLATTGLLIVLFSLILCLYTVKNPFVVTKKTTYPRPIVYPSSVNHPPIASPGSSLKQSPSKIMGKRQTPQELTTLKTKTQNRNLFVVENGYKWVVVSLVFLLTSGQILFRIFYLPSVKRRDPPYQWPLHVTNDISSLHDTAETKNIAIQMRARQTLEVTKLDLDSSIDRTVAAGGFPQLSFGFVSRHREYVVIINRCSARDHLAEFYSELVQVFRSDGVHVIYYFLMKTSVSVLTRKTILISVSDN